MPPPHRPPHRLARGRGLHPRVRHRQALVGLQLVPGELPQPHPGQHRPAGAPSAAHRSRLPRRLSRPPRFQRPARAEAGARPRLGRIYGLPALLAPVVHRRGLGQLRHRARFPRRRAARVRDPRPLSARRPVARPRRRLSGAAGGARGLAGARFTIARDYLEGRIEPRPGDRADPALPARLAGARRAVDRLHRPVSRLCDQLRPRP